MDDLERDFAAAQARVKAQAKDPGTEAKLRLYALYKQATVGDVQGKRPGFTDPVGRAKYDSWASVSGMSRDAAKLAYIEMAATLPETT
ncbi:MAG TPA: acyl-CoA-binding protein [Actinopolymorphaceae bacterium]|jgi:acyl-CoA-binding protein